METDDLVNTPAVPYHHDLLLSFLKRPQMYFYKHPSWLEVIACLSGITIASRFLEPGKRIHERWSDFLNELESGRRATLEEERNFWPDFRAKHDSDAQAITALHHAYKDFLDRNYPLPDA
jgi:hypothetical protein